MSAIQEAAANTVFRIANLFEQNCALRHGLPKVGGPDRIDMDEPPAPQPINITNNIPAAPAATSFPSPGPVAAPASSSLLRRAAPFILAGTLGAVPGGYALWQATQGTEQPAAPSTITPSDGDLLQELQRQGRHLPEGWPNG